MGLQMARLTQQQVEDWIAKNGGTQGLQYSTEQKQVKNPDLGSPDPPYTTIEVEVWRNPQTGAALTVRRGEDGDFEQIENTGPKPASSNTPARTPGQQRDEEEEQREKEWNAANGGLWETHAQRAIRERQEQADRERQEDRRRQTAADEARNANERERIGIARGAEERAAAADQRRAEADARREQLDRDKYDFERDKANRPQVISQPGDDDKQIAVYDPATGTVTAQANPLYDEAKVAAKRKQEELALAIQHNRMTAEQAAAEYTRWFKETVELPFLQAAERRAQATEKRQALEAEERRRQFAASHEVQRAQVGQQAANTMLDAEMALNPYRVGPAFGEQMSAAVNSLAAGGRLDTDAAAGINFTADAFEYKRPDLDRIARKATAAALRNLTPYRPSTTSYDVADYSGIPEPTSDMLHTAPASPSFIDTRRLFDDATDERYIGPIE